MRQTSIHNIVLQGFRSINSVFDTLSVFLLQSLASLIYICAFPAFSLLQYYNYETCTIYVPGFELANIY